MENHLVLGWVLELDILFKELLKHEIAPHGSLLNRRKLQSLTLLFCPLV